MNDAVVGRLHVLDRALKPLDAATCKMSDARHLLQSGMNFCVAEGRPSLVTAGSSMRISTTSDNPAVLTCSLTRLRTKAPGLTNLDATLEIPAT